MYCISHENISMFKLDRTVFFFFKCLLSKNSAAVLEKPCMDADQHHMSPASGLSAGNFALMFQASVHWGRATTHRTSVSVHRKHQKCNTKVWKGQTLLREAQTNGFPMMWCNNLERLKEADRGHAQTRLNINIRSAKAKKTRDSKKHLLFISASTLLHSGCQINVRIHSEARCLLGGEERRNH